MADGFVFLALLPLRVNPRSNPTTKSTSWASLNIWGCCFHLSGRLGFGFHHADTHPKTASLKLVKDDIFDDVGFVYASEIRGNISNPDIFEAEFIRLAAIAAALNVITQRILKEAWFTLLRMRLPPLSMLCSIGL